MIRKKQQKKTEPDQRLSIICLPISGRVDRAFATETVDLGSIPSRVKPKLMYKNLSYIYIHNFSAWRSAIKKVHCEASTVCDEEESRCKLDSKTVRSLCCFLATATWRINRNCKTYSKCQNLFGFRLQ